MKLNEISDNCNFIKKKLKEDTKKNGNFLLSMVHICLEYNLTPSELLLEVTRATINEKGGPINETDYKMLHYAKKRSIL